MKNKNEKNLLELGFVPIVCLKTQITNKDMSMTTNENNEQTMTITTCYEMIVTISGEKTGREREKERHLQHFSPISK